LQFGSKNRVGSRVKINFIHITPTPLFARLKGLDNRMAAGVKMLGGVLVLGAVTTADVAAFQAKPQVNPMIAGLKAIFATVGAGGNNLHLVLVSALVTHGNLLLSIQFGPGPVSRIF
jgi:hypothetical protein